MDRFLFKISGFLPCRIIDIDDRPYLERYFLFKVLGLTVYLHRFLSDDGERRVHDHPWRFMLSLVLCGSYTEERLIGFDPDPGWHSKYCKRRFINLMSGRTFHRISSVRPKTWTLFCHSPRFKGWGFLMKIAKAVVFLQPYDTQAAAGWRKRAELGRDAGRQAYRASDGAAPKKRV